MDKREKHVRENAPHHEADNENLLSKGKNQQQNGIAKSNRLWIWLGVIVLIFILLYWLFAIGTFEDLIGYFNG